MVSHFKCTEYLSEFLQTSENEPSIWRGQGTVKCLGPNRIMNDIPPVFRDQRKVDSEHLNLLAIFHFVGAGFAVLGILFLFAHYAFLHAMLNHKMWVNQKGGPPPAEFFAIFKWIYVVGGIWCFCSFALNLISGFCLRARKARTFSMVVAGINCLHMPLGTVLGVFTIVVLVRDSVRQLYGER
jgi:hypothetical protein